MEGLVKFFEKLQAFVFMQRINGRQEMPALALQTQNQLNIVILLRMFHVNLMIFHTFLDGLSIRITIILHVFTTRV